MRKQYMWFAPIVLLLGAGTLFRSIDTSVVTATQSPKLEVNPKVVAEKIADKKRRLESGGKKQPKNPGGLALERFRQRAGKDGKIPLGALVRAKERVDEMRGYDRDAGLWDWEWLGPGNIGGRIRTILPDPTNSEVLWIGSVAGGIWKTVNGGSSWSPVDDFMANLAITSLAMDANDPNVMYAATGEGFYNADALPGAGIFKSTDGGTTWTQLPSTNNSDFQYVNRLAVDPVSSGKLWAVTRSNKVWRTTDAGDSWDLMLSAASAATDIKVHSSTPSLLLVGTRTDAYLSTDGGTSWTLLTTGDPDMLPADGGRCEVAFSSNPDIMYVSMDRTSGEIWRSVDGGTTWTLMSRGIAYLGAQGWYDNVLWVSPNDSDFIVVGGINLWRSTNGGATLLRISDWTEYHTGLSAHGDHHAIVANVNFPNDLTIYFGNDGGIQKTADITTVSEHSGWVNLANNLGITQFYGGAATRDGGVIIGGTQDNDQLRLLSGGGTGSWYQPETGDGGFAAATPDDPNVLYGEYVYLRIEKSTDGGDTYLDAITGLGDANDSNNANFIAPFVMDPNDSNTLIAGGSSIWQTTNQAVSWFSIRGTIAGTPNCTAIDIAQSNSNVIWIGYTDGTVSRSTDGGLNWLDVDDYGVGLPNRWVTDISINPLNTNEIFVTFSGYNLDNVWMTQDGGASWEQRTGSSPDDLPALQVNTVRHHPQRPQWVYIGTDLGVFASDDKGLIWSVTPRYLEHEGPVNVEVSEVFFYGGKHLVAATHGRGMYRTEPLLTLYVDGSNTGYEDGSQEFPFNTVQEALNVTRPSTVISIETGNYNESVVFSQRGTIVATNGTVSIGAP